MRASTIYERGGVLYLHSQSRTTAGVWILSAPAFAVGKEYPDEVGRAICECLTASHENVPHPTSFARLFDPVLELAGVRTWRAFAKSAKCVEVETSDDATVVLSSTRNAGPTEGFIALPIATRVPFVSDVLGRAALDALANCE